MKKLVVTMILSIVVSGCWGRMLPGKTIIVGIGEGNAEAQQVVQLINDSLLQLHFIETGPDGHDALEMTTTALHYDRNDGLGASISWSKKEVMVRVSTHARAFGPTETEVISAIRDKLRGRLSVEVSDN